MTKPRCIIIIDGSNFYHKLKEIQIHDQLSLNWSSFLANLAGENRLVGSCYYVGKIRQNNIEKTQKLFDGQQKLLGLLKKHQVKYQFGYLLKTDRVYHEKGVDVQMAVDIVVAAYEKTCDRIILISSDTDLAPAIKKARAKEVVVEYVGFSHKPSVAMVSFCNESTLLKKEDILKFLT
jgi:uncharacterized LabA/DUF88 family protein